MSTDDGGLTDEIVVALHRGPTDRQALLDVFARLGVDAESGPEAGWPRREPGQVLLADRNSSPAGYAVFDFDGSGKFAGLAMWGD